MANSSKVSYGNSGTYRPRYQDAYIDPAIIYNQIESDDAKAQFREPILMPVPTQTNPHTNYKLPKKEKSEEPHAQMEPSININRMSIKSTEKISPVNIEELDRWKIMEEYTYCHGWRTFDGAIVMDDWRNGITVAFDAYAHPDKDIKGNRSALLDFKQSMRQSISAGNKDDYFQATALNNYTFLDMKPPCKVCVQCSLSLQVIPLACIGQAVVYMEDDTEMEYDADIFYIALLCENYPLCVFPMIHNDYSDLFVGKAAILQGIRSIIEQKEENMPDEDSDLLAEHENVEQSSGDTNSYIASNKNKTTHKRKAELEDDKSSGLQPKKKQKQK
eukprot:814598_1